MIGRSSSSFTHHLPVLYKALLHLSPPWPWWGAPPPFTCRLTVLYEELLHLLHLPPPYPWWGTLPPLSLTASLSFTRRSSTSLLSSVSQNWTFAFVLSASRPAKFLLQPMDLGSCLSETGSFSIPRHTPYSHALKQYRNNHVQCSSPGDGFRMHNFAM